jgi:UDPglucose 6-dehydrogenase
MVLKGIASDSRIGPSFLFPGPGYGGSCFPKDVKALVRTAAEMGMDLQVLSAVEDVNQRQKLRLGEKVREAIGDDLSGMHIAVWGLAFKPQTDDMRDAPSITLIEDLLAAGATVCAHDPASMKEARHRLGERIDYAETNYDALHNADALVVVTDWNEYRHPDFSRVKDALRKPVIVDGRNLYDPEKMREHGFRYYSMGRTVIEQGESERVGEYA